MPLPTVPDWLNQRDGGLKPGTRDYIAFVTVGGAPLYKLEARPAAGRYTCYVSHTINGRRVDDGKAYPSLDAALAGGLDELRDKLGW